MNVGIGRVAISKRVRQRGNAFSAAIGNKAEESNADKARWQDAEKEVPQELFSGHGHYLLFAAMRIILPTEVTFPSATLTSPWLEMATRWYSGRDSAVHEAVRRKAVWHEIDPVPVSLT